VGEASDGIAQGSTLIDLEAVPRESIGKLRWRMQVDSFTDLVSHSQWNRIHEILLPNHDGRWTPFADPGEIFEEMLERHPSAIVASSFACASAKKGRHRKLSRHQDESDYRSGGRLERTTLALDVETRKRKQEHEPPGNHIRGNQS